MSEERKELVRQESVVSRRILELFEKYNTPATWAILEDALRCVTEQREQGKIKISTMETIVKEM